jgi:hypothetical protein
MKRYQVSYLKRFVTGPLEGIELRDKVTFATHSEAERFSDWVESKQVKQSSTCTTQYRTECPILEAITH